MPRQTSAYPFGIPVALTTLALVGSFACDTEGPSTPLSFGPAPKVEPVRATFENSSWRRSTTRGEEFLAFTEGLAGDPTAKNRGTFSYAFRRDRSGRTEFQWGEGVYSTEGSQVVLTSTERRCKEIIEGTFTFFVRGSGADRQLVLTSDSISGTGVATFAALTAPVPQENVVHGCFQGESFVPSMAMAQEPPQQPVAPPPGGGPSKADLAIGRRDWRRQTSRGEETLYFHFKSENGGSFVPAVQRFVGGNKQVQSNIGDFSVAGDKVTLTIPEKYCAENLEGVFTFAVVGNQLTLTGTQGTLTYTEPPIAPLPPPYEETIGGCFQGDAFLPLP